MNEKELRSTGIIRGIDELGRVSIPIEIKRSLNISTEDPVEFLFDDQNQRIGIRKYRTQECILCREKEHLKLKFFKGYYVCESCINNLPPEKKLPRRSISSPERNSTFSTQKGKITNKNTIEKIKKVEKENPHLCQKKMAQIIGISQPRVSQVKKLLSTKTVPSEKNK
ncbi:AbrB/MazE/SpoVT family DNA-binding domain-containing protein [Paenibacillus ehimensis]|uniref:AbrB/MazE/SpoVT family DNA-binding domain-containing protein n=1 Tax=Paenibacillus ehimensis TaxID=79264 RepID=UPI00046F2E7C|nr:AbrB/MazE/SpoVT family DNA-binding domain-containing protein [Paenibacillus ehimensis]